MLNSFCAPQPGHPEHGDFESDLARLIKRTGAAGSIAIPATMPPRPELDDLIWTYNAELYQSSKVNRLPLIDLGRITKPSGSAAAANTQRIGGHRQASSTIDGDHSGPGYEAVVQHELAETVRQIKAMWLPPRPGSGPWPLDD